MGVTPSDELEFDVHRAVVAVVREEAGILTSSLVRMLGDFGLPKRSCRTPFFSPSNTGRWTASPIGPQVAAAWADASWLCFFPEPVFGHPRKVTSTR